MEYARFRQLSDAAENDEDVAEQLAHELYLDPASEKARKDASFEKWVMEQGDLYIAEDTPPPDDEEIDKLSEEIDF